MTKIHYIYVGQPPVESYQNRFIFSSPMRRKKASVDINIWINAKYQSQWGDFIADKGITANLKVLDHTNFFSLPSPEFSGQLYKVTERLSENRCFAALKDLWSLVVLYMEGGYYLDASTHLASKRLRGESERPKEPDRRDIDTEIRKKIDDEFGFFMDETSGGRYFRGYSSTPCFPNLIEPLDKGRNRSTKFRMSLSSIRPNLAFIVPYLDYWLIFSQPQDPTILKMAQKYMKFFAKPDFALDPSGYGTSGRSAEEFLMSSDRDLFLGRLIEAAVMEAFLESWPGINDATDGANLTHVFFGRIWHAYMYTRPGDSITRVYVPELGLIKRYEGSWRGLGASTSGAGTPPPPNGCEPSLG